MNSSHKLIFWARQIWGQPSYNDMPESEALELIHYAYQKWIITFDTAPIYGNGKSEERIGKALKEYNIPRENVHIISKFGIRWKENWENYFCFSGGSIREELEESLTRLQTDYIDTYLLHIPDEGNMRVRETLLTLNKLKREWKIKAYWVCNTYSRLLESFLWHEESEVEYVEDFYNMIEKKAERLIFPYLTHQKFLAYSPFFRGVLTERSIEDLLKRNENSINRLIKNQSLPHVIKQKKLLELVAQKKGVSLQKLAFDFLNNNEKVYRILFGTTQKSHIDMVLSLLETSESFSDK